MADSTLAQTFGLDEVGFQVETTAADGTTTEATFTLGKCLSADLIFSVQYD